MHITLSKPVICGLALAVTLISGVILSNSGKPYSTGIFTIHKLIAVGTAIVIAASIYNLARGVHIRTLYLIIFAATGLLFLTLIISGVLLSLVDGALLNLGQTALQAILRIHQIMPLLALVASTLSLYLMVSSEVQ